MKKYNWILFDADGTLFDYEAAEKTALKNSFNKYNLLFNHDVLNLYRSINSKLWKELEEGKTKPEILQNQRFEILFDKLNIKLSGEEFNSIYLDYLGECTQLTEGTFEVLSIISNFYSCAIVTNGLKKVQRTRFENSSIKNFIKEIIISEEIGYSKPSRDYFEKTFEIIGNPQKSEVLIIGDSITADIKGGFDYGIDTCWFNPMNKLKNEDFHIVYEIKDLNELLNLL